MDQYPKVCNIEDYNVATILELVVKKGGRSPALISALSNPSVQPAIVYAIMFTHAQAIDRFSMQYDILEIPAKDETEADEIYASALKEDYKILMASLNQ